MPAALSVRVSASCNGTGQGELTINLLSYASGETVTVDIDIAGGGYSVEFPTETSPHVITTVPNGIYIVSVTGTTSGTGDVYINSSSVVSADGEIEVSCTTPPPPGPGCDLTATPVTVIPATEGLSDGQAFVNATSSNSPIEYSLNGTSFQSSNIFTGLAAGTYTVYMQDALNTDCTTETSFVIGEVGVLSTTSIPSRDWLPAGLPITYVFTAPDPVNPEPLVVQVMVSDNGTSFTTESDIALIQLEADNLGNYSFNVAPYLQSSFEMGFPSNGTDRKLWKYYYLKVWGLADYEAGNPATIETEPARALNATVLTPLDPSGITVLTRQPEQPLYDSVPGISTVLYSGSGIIMNADAWWDSTIGSSRCPKYPVTLYWLNRWGGWQCFTFDGKHEYSDEVGEAVLWKDSSGATHVASIPDVEKKVAVKSGLIPNNYYDLACSIRYAIRVFQDIDGVWHEGRIEGGSFPTRREGERLRECNFTFVYSEPLAIQQA